MKITHKTIKQLEFFLVFFYLFDFLSTKIRGPLRDVKDKILVKEGSEAKKKLKILFK